MPISSDPEESVPLVSSSAAISPTSSTPALSAASRTKLQGRRYLSPESPLRSLDASPSSAEIEGSWSSRLPPAPPTPAGWYAHDNGMELSEKAKGKRPVRGDSLNTVSSGSSGSIEEDDDFDAATIRAGSTETVYAGGQVRAKQRKGRNVTVMFANAGEGEGGNLELWVEDGENVASVKDQIRHLRPTLLPNSLKLIHAGRLLTDGILLVPWLRSLEERVRRQASGMGGDVEEVLKDVGLAEGEDDAAETGRGRKDREEAKVFLHCTVGPKEGEAERRAEEDEPSAPRRRGFDVLLDAGLSQADVAQMRRQFYESRGEEVPEGLERGDVDDEHARALEEQWIEGDLTADTATTSSDGMYSSIMNGLLTGFFYPILPVFFFREVPLPNFFDAEAEARGETVPSSVAEGSIGNGLGEVEVHSMISQRVQIGVLLGMAINFAFGALRFVN